MSPPSDTDSRPTAATGAPAAAGTPGPETPPPCAGVSALTTLQAGSAVLCSGCGRAFRAPTDQPGAVIECPWCRVQAPRESLKPRQAVAPRPVARPVRLLRTAGAAAGLGVGVLVAMAAVFHWWHPSAGHRPLLAARSRPQEPALPRGPEAVLQEARTAAARALGCPDWTSARPFLLDAERLTPLMESYHARHPWVPLTLVGPHQGSLSSTGTAPTAHLTVRSDRGSTLALRLQQTPEGWKLDWERLVDAPQFAWQQFHEEPATAPVSLHVLAIRGSATDAHFTSAGLTPETGLAVRLDGPHPGLPVLAIVPKASDVGRLFQRELTWEHALPYRCRLRMADAALVPPRVEITEFQGAGWEP